MHSIVEQYWKVLFLEFVELLVGILGFEDHFIVVVVVDLDVCLFLLLFNLFDKVVG